MKWEPLTRIFCAESEKDGVVFAHTYDATDSETAERIAESYGWTFLGELHETVEVTDGEVAMFERDITESTIH